ncbi:MAG TPA: hypothetical protein VL049_21235, partial [Candidatus Dormibacteraeota bacterium]|nr:hypothetical protein [Candidatus Dormibacteraeota bacterium]
MGARVALLIIALVAALGGECAYAHGTPLMLAMWGDFGAAAAREQRAPFDRIASQAMAPEEKFAVVARGD